jgi:hypothetical protein
LFLQDLLTVEGRTVSFFDNTVKHLSVIAILMEWDVQEQLVPGTLQGNIHDFFISFLSQEMDYS